MARNKSPNRLAITMGDPCGTGPEIIVKVLESFTGSDAPSFVIVGDEEVLAGAADRYSGAAFKKAWKKALHTESADSVAESPSNLVLLVKSNLKFEDIIPGMPGAREGKAAAAYLSGGLGLVQSGICTGLVTAPVSKAGLKAGGFQYPGHTDWLGSMTGGKPVMMMMAGGLRTVPLTVHIPLSKVPAALTTGLVYETIMIVWRELQQKFGTKKPRLVVAGMNPHAGEGGLLGDEEEKVITPAIEKARAQGATVSGPYPADTLFTAAKRKTFDAALCPTHDQAMLPVKTLYAAKAVNVTLGLPLVRTSPAHGTGPDIAWQGKADPRSMEQAIKTAARLAGPME